jgi:dTDP-4-amino-4,6-dideoxygalactose transaminase
LSGAVHSVLKSGAFVLGPEVQQFEAEVGKYLGVKHAIGLNSGTDALVIGLRAMGIKPGDEVITSSFSFFATAEAIEIIGAKTVFVDIDPETFNLDVGQIEGKLTKKTKAILPVHLYGQPADMDPIRDVAARHGLVVIEDAAQAHAARYKGRPAGSLGDLACFSFYPSKNLGAYGEGGIVLTSRDDLAERLRLLRNWGERTKYEHLVLAFNARLQGLQGAILRVKLRHLEDWTERRRRHAARYHELLADAGLELPIEMPYARHVYHLYTVRARDRSALQAALKAADVQTGLHYPKPVHLQPAYAHLGYRAGAFPVSEALAAEVLSLPMFPELTGGQIEAVAAAVRRVPV